MDQYSNFEEHNEGAAMLDLLAEDTTERDENAQFEEYKPSLDLLTDYVTEMDKEDKQLEEPKHYESSTSFDLPSEFEMENDEDGWYKESEYYENVMLPDSLDEYAIDKYEDEQSFMYDSDFDQSTIAEGIKRINELRIEQVNLVARRSNVMKMLIELYERNLVCSSGRSIRVECQTTNSEDGLKNLIIILRTTL